MKRPNLVLEGADCRVSLKGARFHLGEARFSHGFYFSIERHNFSMEGPDQGLKWPYFALVGPDLAYNLRNKYMLSFAPA